MSFVVNWEWQQSIICYVVRGQPDKKPYTSEIKEAQQWKTHAGAVRFLARKDPTWASHCRIIEVQLT